MGDIEEGCVWKSMLILEHCCIYRVPNRLRRVNPAAYTPQMLLLGPLTHSMKAKATIPNSSSEDLRYLDYMNVERHKRKYLMEFEDRYGKATVDNFKEMIQREEQTIRDSYAESTEWIKSGEFLEMILHDSVFILEFFLRLRYHGNIIESTGDILIEKPVLQRSIVEDLILLENQLPYYLLDRMFDPFMEKRFQGQTFRGLVLKQFGLVDKINEGTNFKHFLDLIRCAYVETLDPSRQTEENQVIKPLYTADKLDSAGVKFEAIENEFSLAVEFEKGCLKIPRFVPDDELELKLRNVMAFEQCHYPLASYVCNYVSFLDFLINTDKDVDLLIEKGVIKGWMGHGGSVADMVNNLCTGVVQKNSCYHDIAKSLEGHYKSSYNRSCAKLRRVYFPDTWKGTATVTAAILLILTFIKTVTSLIQLSRLL